MNELELRAAYGALVALRPAGRGRCVAPEALMRLAEGDATEAERLSWLEHIAGCPDCRRDLDLVRAVADTGAARAAPRGRVGMRVFALAASIVVVVGGAALWRSGWLVPDVPRGVAASVRLVAPLGDVTPDAARALRWRAVSGATQYEAELLDTAGAVVFAGRTADTVLALPATTSLRVGSAYQWRITALLADGRRLRSRAESLRVAGTAP